MVATIYELSTRFDSRASFYGKAQVVIEGDTETLCSYSVPVVQKKGNTYLFSESWNASDTTLRHVKEYLRQHGWSSMTKAELAKKIKEENLIGNF